MPALKINIMSQQETFVKSNEKCLLYVPGISHDSEGRFIDMGNYYQAPNGEKVLITSQELAQKYGRLINWCPVYTRENDYST